MPIRPELRAFYTSPAWLEIHAQIIARAGNRCERCKKPNAQKMLVTFGGYWCLLDTKVWRDHRGGYVIKPPIGDSYRVIRCVLTIAHLDHDHTNNDEANLAALCQRCHLVHDTRQHYANARRTRAEQCGQIWILPEMEARV